MSATATRLAQWVLLCAQHGLRGAGLGSSMGVQVLLCCRLRGCMEQGHTAGVACW
jgi:hypothetical protein